MAKRILTTALAPMLFIAHSCFAEPASTAADLILLDFEELVNMDVEISSAGKQKARVMDLAYAAYVVTSEEIVKSGADTIPDVLRLIPGVTVAQISASEWSLSIRSSGGRFSRFVLVMVDGRIAYNTVFSGVNWSELNYSTDTIDRIEVIRGPNASAWGANAVNGIIHIITKRGQATKNTTISARGGSDNNGSAALQFNSAISEDWSIGINAHAETRSGLKPLENPSENTTETSTENWRISADLSSRQSSSDTRINLHAFGVDESPFFSWINASLDGKTTSAIQEHKAGWTLLAEHTHTFSDTFSLKVRGAIDDIERISRLYEWYSTNTQLDAEVSTTVGTQQISAGVNARRNDSSLESAQIFSVKLSPTDRIVNSLGLYLSDIITLSEHWQATVSLRWDNNDLSQADTQPSLRLLWQPSNTSSFWGAVSKATATPPRAVNDISNTPYGYIAAQGVDQPLPVLIKISGYYPNQKPTQVRAFEFGWRKAFKDFNIDLALFDQSYTGEVTLVPTGQPEIILDENYFPVRIEQTNVLSNQKDFSIQGFELSTRAQLSSIWTANISYSRQILLHDLGPWSSTFVFQNSVNLSNAFTINIAIRHSHGDASSSAQIEELREVYAPIQNYVVADINASWQLGNRWKLTGLINNIGKKHVEGMREQFVTAANRVEPQGQIKMSYSF